MSRSPQASAPVAVTGIGVVSPIGVGAGTFWRALCDGRSGIAPISDLAVDGGLPRVAAALREFHTRAYIRSPEHRRMDALSRTVVAASRLALDDAAVSSERRLRDVAIVVGSAFGNLRDSAAHLDRIFLKGPSAVSPLLFPNLVLNAPASYAAMELGSMAENFTVAQGEVSGEAAIALGVERVSSGRAEIALAGGGDQLAPIIIEVARRSGALAGQRGGREWSSPYDAARAGLVFGEGAAMLVLEPLEHARRRGARVYAAIEAVSYFAVPAPRYAWPRQAPEALAALAALCGGGAVELVSGGANSSRALDACELDLFARLAPARGAVLTSIKGAVGEFAAAGALTAAAACLAVRDQITPPLCHLQQPAAPGIELAGRRASARRIERALVCGLARGGAGVALLMRTA